MLSNYQQIKNAIAHVCLAGAHFDVQRMEALQAIDQAKCGSEQTTPVVQFVVLFYESNGLSFRGIYGVGAEGIFTALVITLSHLLIIPI
jgi:hypothetical protein